MSTLDKLSKVDIKLPVNRLRPQDMVVEDWLDLWEAARVVRAKILARHGMVETDKSWIKADVLRGSVVKPNKK